MPIAAVPEYLGKHNLANASPALRFGLFLPVWTDRGDQKREVRKRAEAKSREGAEIEAMLGSQGMDVTIAALRRRESRSLPGLWEKNDFGGRKAWQQVSTLSGDDRSRMEALAERQSALADTLANDGRLLALDAESVAPFTTGLGNEHPLENGFAFLNPYGLPYLPGGGVKGVLRQAARELAGVNRGEKWEIESDWSADFINALFGKEDSDDARRGALGFWDVIPRIKGNRLMVEVMTAHQRHYYQKGETPHESGQPYPINFLTLPPGSGFTFHIVCDRRFLARIAPELAEADRWKALLQQAFQHAFDWLGFGAKTAVGYGAMKIDRQKMDAQRHRAEAERAERQRQTEAAGRRAAAEEEARRQQAEFDALPESEKALRRFRDDLDRFRGTPPLGKDQYAPLAGLVGKLADEAATWTREDRLRAADVIEATFEHVGWAPSGLKADKRKKQENKRRQRVEQLRESSPRGSS